MAPSVRDDLEHFVTNFVRIYEGHLSDYYNRLEKKIGKPGKMADLFSKVAETGKGGLEGIEKAGIKALSLVGLSLIVEGISLWGIKHNRDELKKLIPQLFYFKKYPRQVRSILVEAGVEIFYCYQSQFVNLTSDGSWERAMYKLADDAADRVIHYFRNNPNKDVSSRTITQGVVEGTSKSGHTLRYMDGDKWDSASMFGNAGLVKIDKDDYILGYYKRNSKSQPSIYQYRLLFQWEKAMESLRERRTLGKEKFVFHFEKNMKNEEMERLKEEIDKADPELQEERMLNGVANLQHKVSRSIEKGTSETVSVVVNCYDQLNKNIEGLRLTLTETQQQAQVKQSRFCRRKATTPNGPKNIWCRLQEAMQAGSDSREEKVPYKTPLVFGVKRPADPFVGRRKQLNDIKKYLNEGKKVVLTGLGGVGKSEIARMYVDERRSDFGGNIIWLNATTGKTIENSIRNLVSDKFDWGDTSGSAMSLAEDIYDALSNEKVLFVFDDAKDYNAIESYLPLNQKGCYSFLITSNMELWISSRDTFQTIKITDFSPTDACLFIRTALSGLSTLPDEDVVDLAKSMEYLPLALQQATSYIKNLNKEYEERGENYSIRNYLKKYNEKPLLILKYDYTGENSKTILKTVEITIEKLSDNEKSAESLAILDILSYLSPNDIPESIFLEEIAHGDSDELILITQPLKKFSIVTQENKCLNVHGLVQLVRRFQISALNIEEQVLEKALKILDKHRSMSLQSHIISVWDYAYTKKNLIKSFLLNNPGRDPKVPHMLEMIIDGNKYEMMLTILSEIKGDDLYHVMNHSKLWIKNVNMKLTKLLHDHGFNLSYRTCNNSSFLHMAAECGDQAAVTFLVKENIVEIESKNEDLMTSLHYAANKGHINVVEYLTSHSEVDINALNKTGKSPLYMAAKSGHIAVVKYLIEVKGAKTNVFGKYRNSLLHAATRFSHLGVVQYLLDHNYGDVDSKNDIDQTPLHFAVRNGHTKLVEYFIGIRNADKNVRDRDGWGILHYAAKNNHMNIIKYLVSKDCGIEVLDDEEWTPLHYASRFGHFDLLEYFIEVKKGNYLAKSISGLTPFLLSCRHGHTNIVEYLLKKPGVNLNATNNCGMTALHLAAAAGSIKGVKYLVEKMKLSPFITDKLGHSSLAEAVNGGHLEVIHYLIGVPPTNESDIPNYNSLLHTAAEGGSLDTVKLFINKYNAKFDYKNSDEQCALHLAASNDCIDVVKYLVEILKCNINATDKDGWTSLHYATRNNHRKVVEYLLDKGAHILKDYEGYLPIHLAVRMQHTDLVKYYIKRTQDAGVTDNDGWNILHYATVKNYVELVTYLISVVGMSANVRVNNGATPMTFAIENGYLNLVKYFFRKKLVKASETDDDGWTYLHYAAGFGQIEIAAYLIDKQKIGVDFKEIKKRTPLFLAAKEGCIDMVKWLVDEKGAQVESVGLLGVTPLHLAGARGQINVVRFLIDEGHTDGKMKDEDDWTVLHSAASLNRAHIVKYLIEDKGFDANAVTKSNKTPIHLAASGGYAELVKYLSKFNGILIRSNHDTVLHQAVAANSVDTIAVVIEILKKNMNFGENINAKDTEGDTPLMWAAENGYEQAAQVLLQPGNACDVNAQNNDGNTALHWACQKGIDEVIQVLIDNGANATIKNNQFKTPFELKK